MSKRKNGAVRDYDSRFSHTKKMSNTNTYYLNESKTIDFTQATGQKVSRLSTKVIELIPKSINQEKYIIALLDDNIDIVVVSGPAGTGKTYLAMQAAIKSLRTRQCDRIILTRPAVAVDDEKHGFLPGDLNQKMEPWTRPLLDVLREYYSTKEIAHMLEEQIIEIAPLAFCRGRNFKHSWIVLDEAQNCSISQACMLLTRIGEGSKIVVTGDTDQADRRQSDNGLIDLQKKLANSPVAGMQSCTFNASDIRRHKIIGDILKMYHV